MQVKVALKTLFTTLERFLLSNNRRFQLRRDSNESALDSSSDSEFDVNQIKREMERVNFNERTQTLLEGAIGRKKRRQDGIPSDGLVMAKTKTRKSRQTIFDTSASYM